MKSGEENFFFAAKRPHLFALNAVNCCGFMRRIFAVFFRRIHRISNKKETMVHGLASLTSCMSTTSDSSAPSVTYFSDISCEYKISDEISTMKFEDMQFQRGKNLFHRILLLAVTISFPQNSAGSAEKFSFTA